MPTTAFGGRLGSGHALELPFVFDTLATCAGPKAILGEAPPQALADRIHGIWVDFVRGGEPAWPAYDGWTRQVFSLSRGEAATEPLPPTA
jgi:para-nitrobenzyl esterase